MILEGPEQGHGIIDGISDILFASLRDFEHQVVNLPHARFLKYVKAGKSYCTPYLFKTDERLQYFTYSKPAAVFPGYSAMMHHDTYLQIGQPKSVSLNDLLKKFKLRTTANAKRSYGPELMSILHDDRLDPDQVNYHRGSTTQVFNMMVRGRADFIIEFPNRLNYWIKTLNLNPDNFIAVPIKEAPPYTISYIACTKNAWGQAIIKRVNETLHQYQAEKAYLSVLLRWSDEENKSLITGHYQDQINSDNNPH